LQQLKKNFVLKKHLVIGYFIFGKIYDELIAEPSNDIRLPGQYHDRETGLYYNWHRYYKPTVGRYYQVDKLASEDFKRTILLKNLKFLFTNPVYYIDYLRIDKSLNPYNYVENNPLNFVDPLGLKCKRSFWNRVSQNFIVTNNSILGKYAPKGIGFVTGGQVAELTSSITLLNWIKSGFAAATLEGVTFTGLETSIIVGGTSLLNWAVVGVAWEVGVGIGSVISAAIFPCEEEYQPKKECKK